MNLRQLNVGRRKSKKARKGGQARRKRKHQDKRRGVGSFLGGLVGLQQGRQGMKGWGNWAANLLSGVGGMIAANFAAGATANLAQSQFNPAGSDEEGSANPGTKALSSLGYMILAELGGAAVKDQYLKGALKGASTFLALSAVLNSVRMFGAGKQWVKDFWKKNSLVGGTTGVALFNAADMQAKIDEVKAEAAELEEALASVQGDLSPEQEAVYVAAAEHVASIAGPLRAAEKLLENNRLYEGGEAIKDAMSVAIVARALLSGLTAGVAQQMPGLQQQAAVQQAQAQAQAAVQQAAAALQQQAPLQAQQMGLQQLPDVVQVQDAQSGQIIDVPAPAAEQIAVGSFGGGPQQLNLDLLGPWAQWVSSQYQDWSPSEVATAFILKFLANNGHYYGYGPSSVVAMQNYFPTSPTSVGGYTNVGGQAPNPVALTVGGGAYAYNVGGTSEEVLATVQGIFETHFGEY